MRQRGETRHRDGGGGRDHRATLQALHQQVRAQQKFKALDPKSLIPKPGGLGSKVQMCTFVGQIGLKIILYLFSANL